MRKTFYTFKKISVYIFISIIFFSCASASTLDTSIDKNSSMYKYGAIENTSTFPNLAIDLNTIKEQISLNPVIVLPPSIEEILQKISDNQNYSTSRVNESINKLDNKSQIVTFLVGNNLGTLKFQKVQINDQIRRLEILRTQVLQSNDNTYLYQIDEQLIFLNDERLKVEKYIPLMESKFSVFGWLVTML